MTGTVVFGLILAAQYTIHMPSTVIPLGASGVAELRVSPAGATPSLGHPGLVLELRTRGGAGEPALAFPNKSTVTAGGRTIRMQTDAEARGPAMLTVRLLEVFPEALLRPGSYSLTYRIEGAERTITAQGVSFTVTAPRESVPLLFGLLEATQPSLQMAAAASLQRLTGQGYDWAPGKQENVARWKQWWETEGLGMRWKDGVVYELGPLPAKIKRAILAGATVPAPSTRYLPDRDVTAFLIKRLEREGPTAAILGWMAAVPDAAMATALGRYPDELAARGLLRIVTR